MKQMMISKSVWWNRLLFLMLAVHLSWQAVPAKTRIMLISDPHVMGPGLLIKEGDAWDEATYYDRKLNDYSRAIYDEVIATALREKPDLFLISGDLTKDGEWVSHQYVVQKLQELKAAGIKALVVPGNHDMGTSNALIFNGEEAYEADTINTRQFAELYKDFGYGEDLLNALDKIVHQVGTVNTDENRQYAEVNASVEWCNKNVADVYKRRETLKDELFYQAVKNKSNYIKAVTIFALDKIGFNLREKYNGVATEATLELLSDPDVLLKYDLTENAIESAKFLKTVDFYRNQADAAMESIVNKRKKVKAVLPSQYEVDAIAVEVDGIKNHSDRIFVLDLIYNLLERINNFEEAISPDPALVRRWQDKIDLMKSELQGYRKATLEKKTFNQSNYHLFVKLPPQAADYEG